ncbi:hypothetical protein MRX96_039593 [Rhipicephalus microplus]
MVESATAARILVLVLRKGEDVAARKRTLLIGNTGVHCLLESPSGFPLVQLETPFLICFWSFFTCACFLFGNDVRAQRVFSCVTVKTVSPLTATSVVDILDAVILEIPSGYLYRGMVRDDESL